MGMLSGFMAGAGEQLVNIADRRIAKYDAQDLAAARQQAEIDKEKRMEEFAIRGEGRIDARDTARRGLINAESESAASRKRVLETSPDYVGTDIDIAKRKSSAKGEIDREQARLSTLSETTPEMLKAARAKKLATDIDHGAGLRSIQIQTAQLGLEEKRQATKLISEAETTKDPARRAEIIQALTMRGIIKPGEFDTEKVTTEKENPDGTISKTERTQKRQAGAVAGSSGGGGQPEGTRLTGRDGKAYIVQDGVPVLATGAASNTGSSESGARKGFLQKLTDGPEKEYTATVGKDGKITYQKNPRYAGGDIAQPQDSGQWRNIALPSDLSRAK